MPPRSLMPLLCALLVSCALPGNAPPVTLVSEAPLTPDSSSLPPGSWPLSAWWQRYQDPVLDELVARALRDSPDLAQANARLESAREAAKRNAALDGWQLNAQGGISRQRQSDHGLVPTRFLGFSWYTQADLGLKASYQFDWWHKRRMRREADLNAVRASQAEQLAAGITLSSAVVETYLGWQADQAQLALVTAQQALLDQQQAVTAARLRAAVDNADSQYRLDSQRAALSRQQLEWQASAQLRRIVLASLVGSRDDQLPAFTAQPLHVPAATVPEDLRLGLLGHRPDVAAAYWRVKASELYVGAARAEFLPDISLNMMAGLSSIELDQLFERGSATPGAGLSLNLPLFDGGLRQAQYRGRQAELAAAVANYHQTVIAAAREVATDVVQLQRLGAEQAQQQQQQQAATQLLHSAQLRQQRGLTDLRPVLEAQRAQLQAEADATALTAALQQAELHLQVTLGGGYAAPLEFADQRPATP